MGNYEKKNKEQILINKIKEKLSELEDEIRNEAFVKIKVISDLKNRISKESIFTLNKKEEKK